MVVKRVCLKVGALAEQMADQLAESRGFARVVRWAVRSAAPMVAEKAHRLADSRVSMKVVHLAGS